jgi:hypothetical protein
MLASQPYGLIPGHVCDPTIQIHSFADHYDRHGVNLYFGTGILVGRLCSSHKSALAPASSRIQLNKKIITMGMEDRDRLGR